MEKSNYYIGLDVGTDSVGWAVTDENFKLMRLKGKTAWGSRIFDAAESAKNRRGFRTSGRRLKRRRYRLDLLQSLFVEEIHKIDPNFFLRLNESTLIEEDKTIKLNDRLPLFNDSDLEMKYHKAFPTIWHLRHSLLDENDKEHSFACSDIRFIYLAIHHIIKYRGNFIDDKVITREAFKKLDDEYINELNASFKDLYVRLFDNEDSEELSIVFPLSNKEQMMDILTNKDYNVSNKKKELAKLFNKEPGEKEYNNYIDLVVALIAGGSYKLQQIYVDNDEAKEITFKSKWEDNESTYMSVMGDDFDLVVCAKKIFDYFYIKNLLDDSSSLSESFVKVYDEHKKELKNLKTILRETDKNHNTTYYKEMFKDVTNLNGYVSYVGHKTSKGVTVDVFNSKVAKLLENYKDEYVGNESFTKLFNKATNGKLLLIIAHVSNSAIPHQLHENELDLILDNIKDIYPSIYTNKQKILQLFRFIIPYYVGPLNTNSPYSSLQKKDTVSENTSITPWNFNEVVDKDKTRAKFINKLLNKCTYVFNANVLPKASMLYQDFVTLDKINNIKEKELRASIIELMAENPTITIAKLEEELKKEYRNKVSESQADDISIKRYFSEKDKLINTSRILFHKAFKISRFIGDVPQNPDVHEDNSDFEMVEKIISILEVFSQSRNDAINYIKKEYSLTEDQIKIIKQYKCQSWGKLSKELLLKIYAIDENGESNNKHWIYKEMLEGSGNFMQVLYDKKYRFNVSLDLINKHRRSEATTYDSAKQIIDELPPMMRRSTIQATRIVDEIIQIKKTLPKNIIIEVTRGEDIDKKGKYTKSRKEEIKEFLNVLSKDIDTCYKERAKELKDELEEYDEGQLRGKHLYLYFKQLGFDLYTGEKITSVEDVLKGHKYDIDHIYPQSIIKDDSIDNMVLVNKDANEKVKSDRYPIPAEIRNKCANLWRFLRKKNAISEEKYSRLTRTTELSDDELTAFAKRQINVVNHSNIAIVQYLKEKYGYKDNEIILSKSAGASFLRTQYEIPKLRELNDTHHAVDAYLNIVSGVILSDYFTNRYYLYKEKDNWAGIHCNFERALNRQIIGKGIDTYLTSLNERHDFLLTYRTKDNDAAFSKLKASKAKDNDSLFPLHSKTSLNKTSIYGGYDKCSFQYLVKGSVLNKKGLKSEIMFPIYHFLDVTLNKEKLIAYLQKTYFTKGEKLIDIDLEQKIYASQKVFIKGCQYLLTIMNLQTVVLKPITPIFLDKNSIKYLKGFKNACEKYKNELSENSREFFKIVNKEGEITQLISKGTNLELFNNLVKLACETKYDYCPLISNIRTLNIIDAKNYIDFQDYTLFEQCDILMKILSLFTRNHDISGKYSSVNFRKSINSILKDDVVLIYDSITGLYSSKRKL